MRFFEGGKFKIKQWKIIKAKGTKFSSTNRCIKIRLWGLLQWGVNWGEMIEKGGEFVHKRSGINRSKVFNSNIYERKIKYSSSLTDRQ